MPGPADTAAEPIDDVRIREILSRWWGFEQLRPLQSDAIRAALAGRDSLVVMPTGGGKSLCYQLPPLVSETTDVVISPLVALMKDQVDSLEAIGYPAAAIHSGLSADERQAEFFRAIKADKKRKEDEERNRLAQLLDAKKRGKD